MSASTSLRPTSLLTRSEVKPGAYALAHWKNVANFVWRTRADAEGARAATSFANQLMRDHEMFSVLHVVEETADLPTPEGRDVLVSTAKANKPRVACIGVLLPKSDIVATMLRAFVRGVRTLLRGDLVAVVEQDVTSLTSAFVATHERRTNVRLSAREFAKAIEATRRLVVG